MKEIVKFHLDKIENSFFNKGIFQEIDLLQNKIEGCYPVYT